MEWLPLSNRLVRTFLKPLVAPVAILTLLNNHLHQDKTMKNNTGIE